MALLTTQLYVIRHAVAEDVAADGDDHARPLTRKGSRRFARLVQRLARAGMAVDLIATSPLVRTRQTAEILAEELAGQPPVVVVDALAPPAVTVSVSEPSVNKSAAIGTEIVAAPLEFTVALPVSDPPVMSAALTPDKVYGTEVPGATFVVVSVKVAVDPSLTLALLAAMA